MMPEREKVIEGLENLRETIRTATQYTFTSGSICAMSMKRIDNAISLLKEQEETIQITKNVAERYANILADKGVNGVCVRYAVKKGKQFMLSYQNKKASWCYGLDGAWITFDREMAEGFAKLTNGKLIEVTLTERPLKVTGKLPAS